MLLRPAPQGCRASGTSRTLPTSQPHLRSRVNPGPCLNASSPPRRADSSTHKRAVRTFTCTGARYEDQDQGSWRSRRLPRWWRPVPHRRRCLVPFSHSITGARHEDQDQASRRSQHLPRRQQRCLIPSGYAQSEPPRLAGRAQQPAQELEHEDQDQASRRPQLSRRRHRHRCLIHPIRARPVGAISRLAGRAHNYAQEFVS